MAAILGTPEVSDRNGKDQFLDWKSDSMSVNAYYYDGVCSLYRLTLKTRRLLFDNISGMCYNILY